MPMMQTATYSRRQDDDVVYLFPGENALNQVIVRRGQRMPLRRDAHPGRGVLVPG